MSKRSGSLLDRRVVTYSVNTKVTIIVIDQIAVSLHAVVVQLFMTIIVPFFIPYRPARIVKLCHLTH